MPPDASESPIGLLLSGGLDSAILLGTLVGQGRRVQPFYVRSQLFWEPEELQAARRSVEAISSPLVDDLVVLDLPLADLYDDHWSVTGHEPRAYYARIRSFLEHHRPGLPAQRPGWRELRALFRSFWLMGVVHRGRRAYWRFLGSTLLRHPAQFGLAMTLAVYGHHFRQVARHL